jgi:zinc transport system substrate-binding protein
MTKHLFLLIFFLALGCEPKSGNSTGNGKEKPVVAVTSYPLYYFAKVIGGDLVSVYFPAFDGDPAYWKPSAKQVLNFQRADVILANGAGYEKWMEKVSLPSSKIVVTSRSFRDQWIEVEEGVAHSHGKEGKHVHKGTAFTTWMNFKFAMGQAAAVKMALAELLPDQEEVLAANFDQLEKQLKDLDSRMVRIGEKLAGDQIVSSHPVYQYIEQAYGIKAHSFHWEPEEMPDPDEWEKVAEILPGSKSKIMIWESEPVAEIKSKLEVMGVKIVVFDPCSNRPDADDFLSVMDKNVSGLERVLHL